MAKLSARNSASGRGATRSSIWGHLHRASNRADRHARPAAAGWPGLRPGTGREQDSRRLAYRGGGGLWAAVRWASGLVSGWAAASHHDQGSPCAPRSPPRRSCSEDCALLRDSAWNTWSACCANAWPLSKSSRWRCRRPWSGRSASGMQCLMGCPRGVVCRSLRGFGGGAVFTATSRSAVPPRAALATEVCERGGSVSSLRGGPTRRALIIALRKFFRFELNKFMRACLSGGCAGAMFRLHVPTRAAFRMRTPAGGRGPCRRCPARTSTTVPAKL